MNFCVFTVFLVFSVFLTFCVANFTPPPDCQSTFLTDCCKGYSFINNTCIPICEGGCPETQICLEPNLCGLEPYGLVFMRKYCGSRLDDNEISYCDKCYPSYIPKDYDCKPYCVTKCSNGICDSDGRVCKCDRGYEENPQTNLCEPIRSSSTVLHFLSSTTVQVSTTENLLNSQTQESTTTTEQNSTMTTSSEEKELVIFKNTTTVTPNCQNNDKKCQCKIVNDRFECSPHSIDTSRTFLYFLWISIALTVLIIILLGYFVYKRMRLVSFNVQEVEKCRSNVVSLIHKHNQQPECIF